MLLALSIAQALSARALPPPESHRLDPNRPHKQRDHAVPDDPLCDLPRPKRELHSNKPERWPRNRAVPRRRNVLSGSGCRLSSRANIGFSGEASCGRDLIFLDMVRALYYRGGKSGEGHAIWPKVGAVSSTSADHRGCRSRRFGRYSHCRLRNS